MHPTKPIPNCLVPDVLPETGVNTQLRRILFKRDIGYSQRTHLHPDSSAPHMAYIIRENVEYQDERHIVQRS